MDVTAVAGRPGGMLLDGRYQLGPALARGGMSTVYRATDTRLDRPVAVKVMDPRLAADPAFRARFEREARSAARIDHPAVVDVYDQGTGLLGAGEPVVFLVMELVEGGTLRDVLRSRGALSVPAAVAVLVPVLDGLAQAHGRGLVHRDVKPENVLISRAGEVKVADFGLVTAAAQAGASHAGMILGTVAYLSPEQVTTGAADARSDVYAAGVLAYELLTGAPPFTGDTPISVAYRHVHDDVPPPSSAAADVPPELDDLDRAGHPPRPGRPPRRRRRVPRRPVPGRRARPDPADAAARAAGRSRTGGAARPHRRDTAAAPGRSRPAGHPRAAPGGTAVGGARARVPARAAAVGARPAPATQPPGVRHVDLGRGGARPARRRGRLVAGQRALDRDADRHGRRAGDRRAAAARRGPGRDRHGHPRRRRGRGPGVRGRPRSGCTAARAAARCG